MVRGLRGASTCDANSAKEITEVTQELLLAMLKENAIDHDDVVSVLFTTTSDLNAMFPATAAGASASVTCRSCAPVRSTCPAPCRSPCEC